MVHEKLSLPNGRLDKRDLSEVSLMRIEVDGTLYSSNEIIFKTSMKKKRDIFKKLGRKITLQ